MKWKAEVPRVSVTLSGKIIAELLCGQRLQEWSPILILGGMLVFFLVMASGMARRRVRRTTVASHDILT